MKLSKPINIEITNVASAVWLMMYLNDDHPAPKHKNADALINGPRGTWVEEDQGVYAQIERQLKEQGIDWRTWLPPQPFKIAGRECEFKADGTVALSCGTVISNDEIKDFLKRREEAAGKWPKYFGSLYNPDAIWVANVNGTCFWINRHGEKESSSFTLQNLPDRAKQITREDAASITNISVINQ